MINWCVWPCDTVCQQSELEEYLTFMSDDFVMCSTPDEDEDAVPSYDEIIAAGEHRRRHECKRFE